MNVGIICDQKQRLLIVGLLSVPQLYGVSVIVVSEVFTLQVP